MATQWRKSAIPGVFIGGAFSAQDERGSFIKPWTRDTSPSEFRVDEVFCSVSEQGVVRGMHVQSGPVQGWRLIFVTHGRARDFAVDLRRGSPTYGTLVETILEPGGSVVLIAPGCAHGFESLESGTTMVYLQEGRHDAQYDTGVYWRSCGVSPMTSDPIVSSRDEQLAHLTSFETPFDWDSSG